MVPFETQGFGGYTRSMADAWVPGYLGSGLLNFLYLSAFCPLGEGEVDRVDARRD